MVSYNFERDANLLLSRLHDEDWQRIARHMSAREMSAGEVLQKAGDEVTYTWFPCGAASAGFQVWVDIDSSAIDVGTIGSEGAIGGIVSNGRVPAYATAEVRSPGLFLAVRTTHLEKAKLESLALRHWFSRYSDCLIAQIFQNAACNAAHTIRQRAARWLLATAERTGTSQVALTHEQLAGLLGVGRSFVTRTVRELRESGLVETRRGAFVLNDKAGLRAASCDCSDEIAAHFTRVMSGIYPEARESGENGRMPLGVRDDA